MPPDEREAAVVEHDEDRPADLAKPPKGSRVVTDAMREANRRNARKPKNPSPEARAKSAGNAVKHSLSSNGKELERRYPELFQRYLDEYLELYPPADDEHYRKVVSVAYACVRIDLYVNTQDAAVARVRAEYQRDWYAQREQTARLALKRLDDPEPISFGMYCAWMTDYSIAKNLRHQLQTAVGELEQADSITPAAFERFLRLTTYIGEFPEESLLPAPLQRQLRRRDRATPDQPVPLTDEQRSELLALADRTFAELDELLPIREEHEARLLEYTLDCLDVFGDSRELQLRYRYYLDAERTFFRLVKELKASQSSQPDQTREPAQESRPTPAETPRHHKPSWTAARAEEDEEEDETETAYDPFKVYREASPEALAAIRSFAPELLDGMDADQTTRQSRRELVKRLVHEDGTANGVEPITKHSGASSGHGSVSSNGASDGHGSVSSNGASDGHGSVSSNGASGMANAAPAAPPAPPTPKPSPPPVGAKTASPPWTVRQVPPEEQRRRKKRKR